MGQSRENWQRWLGHGVFASWFAVDLLLIAIALLFTRQFGAWRNTPTDEIVAFVLIAQFSQMGFAGLWLVFGPGSLALRIPAIFGNLVISAAVIFSLVADDGAVERPLLWLFLMMFATYQLLGLLPLLIIRHYQGWQAVWSDALETRPQDQFRLIHIFLWTTAVACLMVLLRQMLGKITISDNFVLGADDYIAMALLVLIGSFQPVIAGMIFIYRPIVKNWFGLAGLSFVSSLGVALPAYGMSNLFDALVFLAVILGQFAMLSFYLALLRLAGLQLVTAK